MTQTFSNGSGSVSNAVTYDYDSLGRLKSATSPAWTQNYTYDGFANLVKKTGTGAVDWTSSFNSETNGAPPVPLAGHDADNRWITVDAYRANLYDASNQRVVEFVDGEDENTAVVTFRVGGMMLGRYTYEIAGTSTMTTWAEYKYLAGRRMGVGSDRLGSDLTGNRTLLPYGEELSPTANGMLKFATYWRDAATGMDYADQRYYSPGTGRFLTADPYNASAGAENPSSWNRYTYVEGDPVNFGDPQGLARVKVSEILDSIIGWFRGNGDLKGVPDTGIHNVGDPHMPSYSNPIPSPLLDEARHYVRSGQMTDCDAMAFFAQGMASRYADERNPTRFINLLRGLYEPKFGGTGGYGLQASGRQSGFAAQYRDSKNANDDQAHHFGFFFVMGGGMRDSSPAAAATLIGLAAGILELGNLTPNNSGDIDLGYAAGMLGYNVASGAIKPSEVGSYIFNMFCDRPVEP